VALNIPDELTLDHIWKEKKREYAFDAVFAPGIGQEKARTALLASSRGAWAGACMGMAQGLCMLSCTRLGLTR